MENVKLELHATLHQDYVQTDAMATGYYHIVQHVNLICTVHVVHVIVATVSTVYHVQWIQGLVLVDVKRVGLENVVPLSAIGDHIFQTDRASNVKGFAKTMHLVIHLRECVMMDVVCIGQGDIVKNVLMGFTTHNVAAYVVLVLMAMCVKKSKDTALVAACQIIKNPCVKNAFLDSMEKIALNCVETAKRGQYATLDRECVLLVVKSI